MKAKQSASPVLSMTGFASVEGEVAGQRIRLEIKALNHRFLDLKLRLPREYSSFEIPLRAVFQSRFGRGAVEAKLEKIADSGEGAQAPGPNVALAAHYFESLVRLQKTLGLSDPIRTIDVASMPDVFSRTATEGLAPEQHEAALKDLETLVRRGIEKVEQMRAHEGEALSRVLHQALDEMGATIARLREKREAGASQYRERIGEKVRAVFEAYPAAQVPATAMQALLETRIAQELAMLIDRTDIEEELVRFRGHLDHFAKVLDAGGQVGRKLDFILQELNREINTLGNKAQDFGISEEVVQVKVRLEQLREQVMNLE